VDGLEILVLEMGLVVWRADKVSKYQQDAEKGMLTF